MPSRISRPSSAYRRACLSATSRVSPAASSRSRAYSPIVCSIRSRSPWPSVCTSALSTSDSSSSRTLSPGSAQTASTSASVHPPAKTAMRRNRRCSDSVEERVAPVDRGAQRLLPLGNVARAGREHVEGVVEPLEQRLRGQEPQPGGGELERERQAVQAPADRRDGRRRSRASARTSLWSTSRARRTGDADTHERLGRVRRGGSSSGASGYSRSAAILSGVLLVVTIRSSGQRLDQTGHLGSGRHDLLEVVQEQERLPVADQCDDAVAERPSLGLLHVQRVRESGEELRGLGDVGQRDERDTVQELGREQPAELDDDPRLPDAAGARDRDDPMFARRARRATPGRRPGRPAARPGRAGCSAGWRTARPCPPAPPDPARRCRRPRPRRARTGARRS